MISIFSFSSILMVFILVVTTCTYLAQNNRKSFSEHKAGFRGIFYKAVVIGERMSIPVSILCIGMLFYVLFVKEC
ncbi:MAG: hypothetical protein EZS28_008629 [Streblomastix strix]|uniref:Protein kish n=1 Tax=Streblomastix strix TaxID=222440 RepID=A0A5J4WLK5_9EUKA|nr:MAG: hypothetical protein EZS28_008629 [Streblomastix strix]